MRYSAACTGEEERPDAPDWSIYCTMRLISREDYETDESDNGVSPDWSINFAIELIMQAHNEADEYQ